MAELTNEIGLQSMTRHPNIVECIEAYVSKVCIKSSVSLNFCVLLYFNRHSLYFISLFTHALEHTRARQTDVCIVMELMIGGSLTDCCTPKMSMLEGSIAYA